MSIKTRSTLKKEILVSFGHPTINVELEDPHLNLSIDRAIDLYHKFAYGKGAIRDYLVFQISAGVSAYDLPSGVRDIVSHYYGFDPIMGNVSTLFTFENVMWNAGALNVWNWGHFGLITYELAMQYLNLLEQRIPSKYSILVDSEAGVVTVHPTPEVATYLFMETFREVATSALYDQPWVFDWAKAEAMEQLGHIRSKHVRGLPGPGGQIQLNGRELLQQASEEKTRLRQELIVQESQPVMWRIA